MSRRFAGYGAWRREDWPSCQAARHSLRTFWTSSNHLKFNLLGPASSVRIPSSLLKAEYIHVLSPRAPRRGEGLVFDRPSQSCKALAFGTVINKSR